MPDGDILCIGIPGEYSNAYEQICDDVVPADCAKTMARNLRKLIVKYGAGPRDLIKKFAGATEQIVQQVERVSASQLCSLDALIERERKTCNGHRKGLDYATESCKSILYDIRRQNEIVDIKLELASRYVRRVLEGTFDTRIDGIKDPSLGNIPIEIFRQRRQEIQPYLEKYLDHFAKQIAQSASDRGLRLPRTSQRIPALGLDEIIE